MEEYTREKNIAMALQLQKEYSDADIEEMLQRLGLSANAVDIRMNYQADNKRVAIARALIRNRKF